MERHWVRLTPDDFAELKKLTQVALLPVGSIEAHGAHNPFGVDAFWAEEICTRAAAIEPAVVLPTIYYNICSMMKGYPGTIAIKPTVVAKMYQAICEEAARNGFPRIIAFVAHSGSQYVLDIVQEDCLDDATRPGAQPQPFYLFRAMYSDHIPREAFKDDDHGGRCETAMTMAARPGTVKLDRCPGPQKRVIRSAVNAHYFFDWRRSAPAGFAGPAHEATEELGNQIIDTAAQSLAVVIAQARVYRPESDI